MNAAIDTTPLLHDAREIKPGMRVRIPADRCVREAPCAQYREVAAVALNRIGIYSSVDITFTDGTVEPWFKGAEFEVDPDSIALSAEDRSVAAVYAAVASACWPCFLGRCSWCTGCRCTHGGSRRSNRRER